MKRVLLIPKVEENASAPPPRNTVRYGECLKNQAAAIGGHATDGCTEFLATSGEGSGAVTCACCGCHRNFHRRLEQFTVVQGQYIINQPTN